MSEKKLSDGAGIVVGASGVTGPRGYEGDEGFRGDMAQRFHSEGMDSLLGDCFKILDDGFVQVVDYMGGDDAIVQAARISYGSGTKKVHEDRGLIRYLMRHRHTTPFEMCLDGDTRIQTCPCPGATVKHYKMSEIAEAFSRPTRHNSSVRLIKIKTVDPITGIVGPTKIKNAWKSGSETVFRVTVEKVSRSILTTGNHLFLRPDGNYTKLSDLRSRDQVMLNGLAPTPEETVGEVLQLRINGLSIGKISRRIGIAQSTAYKILKQHQMHARVGRDPETYFRKKSGTHRDPRALARKIKFTGGCSICGCVSRGSDRHHMDEDPHNNLLSNLVWLCSKHHRHIHQYSRLKKVFAAEISNIEKVGVRDVYDLEVESENSNFVAEGFVVHNCEIKLHVRVPMDCWRQWIRHRTANVNEYSTRYSEAIDSQQKTTPDKWRKQSPTNRQGSSDFLSDSQGDHLSIVEARHHRLALDAYKERIESGVAREQARKDLPLSTYTEAYWKIDLHNLFHFLSLRMDPHAQYEIRQYSNLIGNKIVAMWCPIAWEAFQDYRLDSLALTKIEKKMVRAIMEGHHGHCLDLAREAGWMKTDGKGGLKSNRERMEARAKFKRLGINIPLVFE